MCMLGCPFSSVSQFSVLTIINTALCIIANLLILSHLLLTDLEFNRSRQAYLILLLACISFTGLKTICWMVNYQLAGNAMARKTRALLVETESRLR